MDNFELIHNTIINKSTTDAILLTYCAHRYTVLIKFNITCINPSISPDEPAISVVHCSAMEIVVHFGNID